MMPHERPVCARLRRRLDLWISSGELDHILPELAALRGVPQPREYHAEGDALTHTLLATRQVNDLDDERVFWAVLLHDIGKTATTRKIDGHWRAHGHDRLSAILARKVMIRLDREALADDVVWLIEHHHFALSWGDSVKLGLTSRQRRFCQHPLFPLLCRVCRADAIASQGTSRKGELLDWIERHAASGT